MCRVKTIREGHGLTARSTHSKVLAVSGSFGTPNRPTEDELRPVTVLFADVVGSTALGERLSPEEVKTLIGDCVTMMSRAVEEFGGVVQAYQGDGICAYFGVPAAHADDPERAARAAMRITSLVRDYSAEIRRAWGIANFDVRVGLNSGQTAVGRVGAGNPAEVALGDTTNVGARLAALADPGTTLVGDGTASRLKRDYELDEVGMVTVKGRLQPVRAWRLVAPRACEGSESGALVGREWERDLLRQALEALVAGRGGIALVIGEEGVGKSRLIAELRSMVVGDVVWLEGVCPSYGGEPYAPLVSMLRMWLDVGSDEEIAVRTKARSRLEDALGEAAASYLSAFGQLLSVRFETPSDSAPLVTDACIAWIEALASRTPVVMAIDDAQWADSATRCVVAELLGLTDRLPLLIVISQVRHQQSEGWALGTLALSEYSHRTTTIDVGPLADSDAIELVQSVFPDLDEAAVARIVSQAEGNPFYLEELLRLEPDGGWRGRSRSWTISSTTEFLPPALEGLLVARIDRLSAEARRFAQAAAAVGRTFPVLVVEELVGDARALTELFRAEVITEVRRYPELECTFRHRLIQEAALSTLTNAAKRALYRQVATAFERVYSGSIDEHHERLAYYHALSDSPASALPYLEKAADRAARLGVTDHADILRSRIKSLRMRIGDSPDASSSESRAEDLPNVEHP
jgi:class 3 adenylate cyclase